jgi:beta-aspartyl-peptidase (threonine type)
MWAAVVHGGAGALEPNRVSRATSGCAEAVQAAREVLARGGSALDAVEAAVQTLEDNPEFNAGRGSALTREGTVEVDAAVMVGNGLGAGAVGAVPGILHPVTLARRLMEVGEHVLLVGAGALAFAREHGMEPEDLVTDRQRERLRNWRGEKSGGTVGAVAIDTSGGVAAATSTGGMVGKRVGRVGDSPILGAGTYADDRGGACSATGHGEAILRTTLSRAVIERLRAGEPAGVAAQKAIAELGQRTGAEAGVIVVDLAGRVGIAHNSANMPWAACRQDADAIESGAHAP